MLLVGMSKRRMTDTTPILAAQTMSPFLRDHLGWAEHFKGRHKRLHDPLTISLLLENRVIDCSVGVCVFSSNERQIFSKGPWKRLKPTEMKQKRLRLDIPGDLPFL